MKRIFVNGTFDLLHRGHLELLNYAKSLGDFLCVGIDTDDRVKEKKGLKRPIYNQEERKFFLENLKAVDEVKLFSNDLFLARFIIEGDESMPIPKKPNDERLSSRRPGPHPKFRILQEDDLKNFLTSFSIVFCLCHLGCRI